MENVLIATVTSLTTAFGAWLLHRRETKKETVVSGVATAALHTELDARMRAHVEFVESRIMSERKYYEEELERERAECAEQINSLAGRLGIAESRLRLLSGVEGVGGEGGLSTP
jgi:hypothetical protein